MLLHSLISSVSTMGALGGTAAGLQHYTGCREELASDPIRPEWVISGQPEARSQPLTRSGRRLASGLWDCTAGTFRWHYGSDEIIHIIEGEVLIEKPCGEVVELGRGAMMHFTPGDAVVWTVPEYVKKFWVDQAPAMGPRVAARRLIGRLR